MRSELDGDRIVISDHHEVPARIVPADVPVAGFVSRRVFLPRVSQSDTCVLAQI